MSLIGQGQMHAISIHLNCIQYQYISLVGCCSAKNTDLLAAACIDKQ